MPDALSSLIQPPAAIKLQLPVDEDIPDIDSGEDDDAASKNEYGDGSRHHVLYTQERHVKNAVYSRN